MVRKKEKCEWCKEEKEFPSEATEFICNECWNEAEYQDFLNTKSAEELSSALWKSNCESN